MVFEQIVNVLIEADFIRLFFPWLLMLGVTYGLLEKYEIFGDNPGVNGTIALATSFFAIGGAYMFLPPGIMSSLAAGFTFSLFGLLGLIMLMAIGGVDLNKELDKDEIGGQAAVVLGVLTFLGAFVFQADVGQLLGGVQNVWQEVAMPIVMLVFILLLVGVTMES